MTTHLADKLFTPGDQERFAALSGDRNPIHLDQVAARRTQAGAPVVHGVHTLLWSLDSFVRVHPDAPPIASIKCNFTKLLYVGETAEVVVRNFDPKGFRLEVAAQGSVVLRLSVVFGPAAPVRTPDCPVPPAKDALQPEQPIVLSLEEMPGRSGRVLFATPAPVIAATFPHISNRWGAVRTSALACSTQLVGMVCPGLHSIYGALALTVCEPQQPSDGIDFRVTATDARFRLVRMSVAGGGLTGTIDSFARMPPAAQPTMDVALSQISAGEFARSTALVIGGSRGLGELTAKLLAAGGAHVVITYSEGKDDALRIKQEIDAHGGACTAISYDIHRSATSQLAGLVVVPDCVYYFATPSIFRRKSAVFVLDRFDEFVAFYVSGFHDVCRFLQSRRPSGVSAFYPSSAFVEERPADMTEYAMAKAAGELLCADMAVYEKPIAITLSRLPRLPTDQTATLTAIETADPLAVMVPLVREVQAKRFA
jgi:acyl dehydratase